jgi:hypothetical protein
MELPSIKPYNKGSELDIESMIRVGNDLDFEFRRQAGNYAWVSTVYAEAKDKSRRLKAELELLEAKLNKSIRKNGEKLTVSDVNARVISHSKYVLTQDELFKAQHYEDILRGFVFALDAKKDMLQQIGAASRQEMDPELRLMAKKLRQKDQS